MVSMKNDVRHFFFVSKYPVAPIADMEKILLYLRELFQRSLEVSYRACSASGTFGISIKCGLSIPLLPQQNPVDSVFRTSAPQISQITHFNYNTVLYDLFKHIQRNRIRNTWELQRRSARSRLSFSLLLLLHFFLFSLSIAFTYSALFFLCEVTRRKQEIRALFEDLKRLRWEIPLPRLSLGIADRPQIQIFSLVYEILTFSFEVLCQHCWHSQKKTNIIVTFKKQLPSCTYGILTAKICFLWTRITI